MSVVMFACEEDGRRIEAFSRGIASELMYSECWIPAAQAVGAEMFLDFQTGRSIFIQDMSDLMREYQSIVDYVGKHGNDKLTKIEIEKFGAILKELQGYFHRNPHAEIYVG